MPIKKSKIEELLDTLLADDYSFEEILEMFDVDVYEAMDILFINGMIDEERVDELLG